MSGILGGIAGNLAGGNIGRAVVSLVLDTTGYNSQLEKAKVETTASTDSMAAGASKWSTAVTAGAAVAAVAVVDFAKNSVSAAIDAQESQLKLANAVQNSANVSESAIPAFQAQAQAIRDLTGVDDDAINAGQSILVNMGLQQDQITQLTPLVVDLAAKYGIDLNTAMKAVGKAVEGSTGGLARMVGPIATGSTAAETYTNVLAKLGATAGFAAQQAKDEPWRLLSSQFQELEEKVGAQLLPALQEMVPVLTDLATNLAPLIVAAFHAIVPVLEDVATAAKGASDALGLLEGHLPDDFWSGAFSRLDVGTHLLGGLTLASGDATQAQIQQRIAQLQAGDAATTAADATGTYLDKTIGLALATDRATSAAQKHVEAMQAERLQLLQNAGGVLGLVSSLEQLNKDQEALNKLEQHGKTDTAAYRDAVLTATTDQTAFKASVLQTAQQLQDAGEKTSTVKKTLQDMARQAGITGAQFRSALGGPLGQIIGQIDHINSQTIAPQVSTVAERNISRLADTIARTGL